MMLQSRLFHLSSGYQVFEEYSSVVDKTKNGQKKTEALILEVKRNTKTFVFCTGKKGLKIDVFFVRLCWYMRT